MDIVDFFRREMYFEEHGLRPRIIKISGIILRFPDQFKFPVTRSSFTELFLESRFSSHALKHQSLSKSF